MPKNKTTSVIPGPYYYDSYGQMIFSKEGNNKVADMRGYGSLISKYDEERASAIQDNTGRMIASSYDLMFLCKDIVEEHNTSKTVSENNIKKLKAILDNVIQPIQKEKIT